MGTLIYFIIIASAAFVYWDATKNRIGKTSDAKTLTNSPAWLWALGVLLIWIVAFPLYLVKRKELVQKARENPVDVPDMTRKIVLGIFAGLFVIVLLLAIFGENKVVTMVKEGRFNAKPDYTISEVVENFMEDVKWEKTEERGELGLVTATGMALREGSPVLVELKFKANRRGGGVQVYAASVDGEALNNWAFAGFLEGMLSSEIQNKPFYNSPWALALMFGLIIVFIALAVVSKIREKAQKGLGEPTKPMESKEPIEPGTTVGKAPAKTIKIVLVVLCFSAALPIVFAVNGSIKDRHDRENRELLDMVSQTNAQLHASVLAAAPVVGAPVSKPVEATAEPVPATAENDSEELNDEGCCGTLDDIDIKTLEAPDLAAIADLKSAYTIAMAYFTQNPKGKLTIPLLTRNGFKKSAGVTVEIVDGSFADLLITSVYNQGGTFVYSTGPNGVIGLEPN